MVPNPFQLLSTARFCVSKAIWAPRSFSTTAVLEAGYKMKSHSGAKKRWRSAPGLKSFKRVCSVPNLLQKYTNFLGYRQRHFART
ncbi:hypothetical protein R3P38DRAFT_1862652 [Favolaschia claudopus]|uniref:Uncharacterized protein n=1 Tax=Favolaschia claudopus TaxID=2862362 RepID=A0AAW0DBM9_9AGAR